jgi:hypothetical protein
MEQVSIGCFPVKRFWTWNEYTVTGTLPSDKLPIFFLKPNRDLDTHVWGSNPRVYIMIDWLDAFRMREKTGTGLQVWLQISGWR